MLALAFFVSVFSTLTWLIFGVAYINDHLNGGSFSSLGIIDISTYLSLVMLPIFILWMIFGYINHYISNKVLTNNMFTLFKQMKKNQDYTDLMARVMLEAEQEIKDGFILSKFDLFVADLNELIADLIQRCSIASPEQIERLWGKVQNGGKWAFGKVIIDVNQNQPNFQMRVFEKSQHDNVIAGTILEWCARYLSLTALLEKHDKERVFIAIIETGVFGKVFSILAPVSDEVRRSREFTTTPATQKSKQIFASAPMEERKPKPETQNMVDYPADKSFVERINPFRKKDESAIRHEPDTNNQRDPFSIALERSFGTPNEPEGPRISAPAFEEQAKEITPKAEREMFVEPRISDEQTFEISTPELKEDIRAIRTEEKDPIQFNNTQKTLKDLKKEWEGMRTATSTTSTVDKVPSFEKVQETVTTVNIKVAEKPVTEDLSYPFSGWTDEGNYNK